MQTVDLSHAAAHLPELVDAALRGETVVIVEPGQRQLRLLPLPSKPGQPTFGSARGLIEIGDNFDDPLPEFEDNDRS